MGKKVFISHSSDDAKLVNILIEFLNELGVSHDDIFCTSISSSLQGGLSFLEQIKNNVQDSRVVIFLLTERFFLSSFCLAELGAAWVLNQNILPIIVPPITMDEYNKTPLLSVHARDMYSENFIRDFYSDLIKKEVLVNINLEDDLCNGFKSQIASEIKILRKDREGFYVSRLIDNKLISGEKAYKIHGLLDIEESPNITEHWITIKNCVFEKNAKLKFKLDSQISKGDNDKLFLINHYYDIP